MELKTMTITVPDSWSDVTISQYQEILGLEDDMNRTNNIISILLNEDVEVIKHMDRDSRANIMSHLSWTNTLPDEKKYKVEVTVNGKQFYLMNLNDLLIGEWIDLQFYCKDYIVNFHKIMNILYRNNTESNNNEELFKEYMMIGDVYGSIVFFSIIASKLILNMQTYLFNQMQEMQMMMKLEEKQMNKKMNV